MHTEMAGPLAEVAGPLAEVAGPLAEVAGPLKPYGFDKGCKQIHESVTAFIKP